MKAAADYAIKVAKERFGKELDFSENGIAKLENLLGQACQNISNSVKDGKQANAIIRTANIWGSYLGEFIRQKWGGAWILKGSERLLSINGIEISPIGFVYQKITSRPEYSVKIYLAEVERKILPPSVIPPQPQKQFENTTQPQEQFATNQPKNTITNNKKLIFTIAGIGGVLLIIIGFLIFNTGGISAKFKSNLNAFLVEAGKLDILTEQGVSNRDFRNQLAEVKSAYSLLNNSWPSSLSAEKSLFDQAIRGWDLTLVVWDASPYLPGDPPLEECVAYILNSNPNWTIVYVLDNSDDWVGILMGAAGQYFDAGKASIDNKLK